MKRFWHEFFFFFKLIHLARGACCFFLVMFLFLLQATQWKYFEKYACYFNWNAANIFQTNS